MLLQKVLYLLQRIWRLGRRDRRSLMWIAQNSKSPNEGRSIELTQISPQQFKLLDLVVLFLFCLLVVQDHSELNYSLIPGRSKFTAKVQAYNLLACFHLQIQPSQEREKPNFVPIDQRSKNMMAIIASRLLALFLVTTTNLTIAQQPVYVYLSQYPSIVPSGVPSDAPSLTPFSSPADAEEDGPPPTGVEPIDWEAPPVEEEEEEMEPIDWPERVDPFFDWDAGRRQLRR